MYCRIVITVNYDAPSVLGGRCREGGISHFQGWKSGYYMYNTRPPSKNSHAMLMTRGGFIPLVLSPSLKLPSYSILTIGSSGSHLVSSMLTHHCAQFTTDLDKCMKFVNQKDIRLIRPSSDSNIVQNRPTSIGTVTLVTVALYSDYLEGLLDDTLESWTGPMVTII